MQNINTNNYFLEITGASNLFEEDFVVIEKFAKKTIEKINRISPYNSLKITFKSLGNTQGTHQRKIAMRMLLSYGNHVLAMDKEISAGSSDEDHNNKLKKSWNIPLMVQETFRALENKVKTLKNKQTHNIH